MSVETLRAAIQERAHQLRGERLLAVGLTAHKRHWRDCPCSWCSKKREATVVIGSHVPRVYRGFYVEDIRDAWREEQRVKYRAKLSELEQV